MSKSRRWIWYILLFIALFAMFGVWYAPYTVVESKNPIIELVRKKNIPSKVTYRDNQQVVSMTHDGLTQKAVLTTPDSVCATIILIHGIRGNKNLWQDQSDQLAKQGIQTLAVDLRAHGNSEGRYTTFGVKEKEDISAWIDWLENQPIEVGELGIWGHSLGGAVAIQSLATDPRLQYGIIQSTFTNFHQIVSDYSKLFSGVQLPIMTNYLVQRAGKIADFNPNEANPLEYSKSITQPVLFFHGSIDPKIKNEYGRQNFEAIPHNQKQFVLIEGGHHDDLWQIGEKEMLETILNSTPRCM